LTDFYPNFVQPAKGKTITTNKITPNTLPAAKIHGYPIGMPVPVEPPKSNWAVTAVSFLILGFISIFLGLFIPAVILYTTILGGALILTSNTLAILSLRED
jgi:hypothetical protein